MHRRQPRAGRARPRRHAELLPTPRLIALDALHRTMLAIISGAAAVIAFDVLAMLAAAALIDDASARPDRLGRGVLLAGAVVVAVVGVLLGGVATLRRLALARFFAQARGDHHAFRDTARVRGQVAESPTSPAQAALVAVGGAAALGAIPCIVLAVESAGSTVDPGAFAGWAGGAVATSLIAVASAVAVWWLGRFDRAWSSRVRANLPRDVVGSAGPVVRVRSRADARSMRRSGIEWAAALGSGSIVLGGVAAFVGVYLHQPGRYADPVSYSDQVERVLVVLPVGGLVLVTGGVIASAIAGVVVLSVTLRELRRADAGAQPSPERLRRADGVLSNAVGAGHGVWAAVGIVGVGWWFAATVETTADGGVLRPQLPVVLTDAWFWGGWIMVGLVLLAVRCVVERQAPRIRNAFGWDAPVERDDNDYPDISLLP